MSAELLKDVEDAVYAQLEAEMKECVYCRERNREHTMCLAEYDGYRCSRAAGHPDKHAACGVGHHPCFTW